MKEWSPQDAMKAYLDTVHLCDQSDKPKVIEPKCMELISAMAAGKGAKRIVEITAQGITPLTIALAVAAKHTGGQLICILPSESDHDDDDHHQLKTNHPMADIQPFIKLVHVGSTACEIMKQIMQLKNIDFAVIDCKFDDDYLKLMLKKIDDNVIRSGSTIVVHNVHHRKSGSGSVLAQHLWKRKVESVTLPIGEGTEMTRILGCGVRKHNRFLVTLHN